MNQDYNTVTDILKYVQMNLMTENCQIKEVAKFARISAEQGVLGETIITTMKSGLEETTNTVKADENGNTDWVVTNPDGEKYIVNNSVFQKKYEIDLQNPNVYKPKGGPVLAMQLNENIAFLAPWGESMKINQGGFLILSGTSDIYGIQESEFNNTYANTEKNPKTALQEALNLMGVNNRSNASEGLVLPDGFQRNIKL